MNQQQQQKDKPEQQLIQACLSGSAREVEKILRSNRSKLDINWAHEEHGTALHAAVTAKSKSVMELLLRHGAQPNTLHRRESPLHLASFFGALDLVKLLLKHKAKPDLQDLSKKTPLFEATRNNHLPVVKELLRQGANPNLKTSTGRAPLHEAARSGNLELVETLVEAEAQVNAVDCKNVTALAEAVFHLAVLEFLLENDADTSIFDYEGQTALLRAAMYQKSESVRLLIDKRNADMDLLTVRKFTAVHYAAYTDNASQLACLLKNGALGANFQDADGNTALHASDWYKRTPMTCKTLNLLLRYGAGFSLKNREGQFPGLLSSCVSCPREKCQVIQHFKKTELIGYEVSESTRLTFAVAFTERRPDDEDVVQYKKELESLKEAKIMAYRRISLYNIFFVERNFMVVLTENQDLQKIHQECKGDFENKYPHYGYILNDIYRRGLRRRMMMDSAKETMELLTEVYLPYEVSEEILKHFSDFELRNLQIENFEKLV